MNRNHRLSGARILAGLALMGLVTSSSAQFAINSGRVTSGGGTSSGGQFAISGTVGLPAGGRSSGGSFAVEGGFESVLVALQHADYPALGVTRAGAQHTLFWTSDATLFVLESTASLTPPILWAPVEGTGTESGDLRSVTLPLPAGPRYYRLRKP